MRRGRDFSGLRFTSRGQARATQLSWPSKQHPHGFELISMDLRTRVRDESSLGKVESKFTVKNPVIIWNEIIFGIKLGS